MSLLALSDELLLQIFKSLVPQASKKSSYLSLVHTCRRFYHIALPLLYQEANLVWGSFMPPSLEDQDRLTRQLKSYSDPGHSVWVRNALIKWHQHEVDMSGQMFSTLAKFPALRNLKLEGVAGAGTHQPSLGKRVYRPFPNRGFDDFLSGCFEMKALRTVVIRYTELTVQELCKLYTIPHLAHLKVENLDLGVSGPPEGDFASRDHSTITRLEFWQLQGSERRPEMDYILSGHPDLKELVLDTRTNSAAPALSVQAFGTLKTSLAKLRLSVSGSPKLERGIETNFATFTVLKELDVHDRLVFGQRLPDGRDLDRCRIVERLPTSLRSLRITFDRGSCALKLNYSPSESSDYRWILAIAESKRSALKHLSYLTIVERMGCLDPTPDLWESGLAEWMYPSDVRDTFGEACITLRVFTRTGLPNSRI